MNHPCAILSAVVFLQGAIRAEILFEEPFSSVRFPVIDDGLKYYGGFGANETNGAAGAASQADVLPGSLTYVDSAGHALTTSGKHVLVDTDRETATISHVYALPTRWVTGDTIWISFVGRQTAGTTARFFNVALRSPAEVVAIGMPSLASEQSWRIWDHNGVVPFASATTIVPTMTQVFALARMVTNVDATQNERFTLWLNPRLDQAPQESEGVTFTSPASDVSSWSDISEIRLGAGYQNTNGPSSAFEIDEIRVGTTARDVTPYLAMAVTNVTHWAADGTTTISWTAAPGAEDTVQWSTNFTDWEAYPDSTRVHPTGAEIATYTTPPTVPKSLYLRVSRKAPLLP